MLIMYQKSLSQGKFPTSWKRANVIPLYKGKGDRSHPSSYRPTSLCSCFGKQLAKVVVDQLTKHVSIAKPLSRIQHGFRRGCSTVVNLLACDATIARHLDKGNPFDIKSFDYQRAFDKVPHNLKPDSLYKLNICPTTLAWFVSFFSERTFQDVVDGVASKPTDVTSGVMQESVLSPVNFCIFLDPLLQAVSELTGPDVVMPLLTILNLLQAPHQENIAKLNLLLDLVNGWSKDHRMPLSLNKSGVLYCGNNNPALQYILDGHPLAVMSHFKDLGVLRSKRTTYCDHINIVAAQSSKL